VQLRHLHLTEEESHVIQRLAGHLLIPGSGLRAPPEVLVRNRQGQPGLWRHGISGDLPILLVHLEDSSDMTLFRQILAAHTWCRTRRLVFDLVVLTEEVDGYFQELSHQVLGLLQGEDRELIDRPGGIFLRRNSEFNDEDRILLYTAARV